MAICHQSLADNDQRAIRALGRLCSAARPGEIIISDSVYKNLNDNKGFSINEELLLKGKKQPVKNWKFTYKLNSINTNKE